MLSNEFKKIEHTNEALKKFLFQFQDKKNINSLIKIISKQLNDLEDTLADLKDRRSIDNALGKQLDVYGLYKNVPRLGQKDEDYRQSIKNQIALDSTNGSCESAINSAKIILGGKSFLYSESFPARLEIFVSGTTCNNYQYNLLKKSVSLGVALGIRFCDKAAFGFQGNNISLGFNTGGYASIIGDIG
jgi:hypothetical protein